MKNVRSLPSVVAATAFILLWGSAALADESTAVAESTAMAESAVVQSAVTQEMTAPEVSAPETFIDQTVVPAPEVTATEVTATEAAATDLPEAPQTLNQPMPEASTMNEASLAPSTSPELPSPQASTENVAVPTPSDSPSVSQHEAYSSEPLTADERESIGAWQPDTRAEFADPAAQPANTAAQSMNTDPAPVQSASDGTENFEVMPEASENALVDDQDDGGKPKKHQNAQPKPASPALHDSPSEHEVDTAHDTAENDPSILPHLKLKKVIKQDDLMVSGTLKSISKNLAQTMIETSPLTFPITLMQKREKPLTYAQAVKSKRAWFDYFNIHRHRYTPKREYGPTLVNSDHEFEGISDRAHGYCWGFATLVRNFTTLAFYVPGESNPAPVQPAAYKSWIKFYQNKIDQVARGEPTIIPGFANFRELSLVPELELYLKLNAMEMWRARAMKPSSVSIFRTAMTPMSYGEVDTLLNHLEARIARGELPKVIFSSLIPSETILGMNTDIHVVLAYKIERLDRKRARIYLWDINFYTETLVKSPKYLEITAEHGILYEPWYEPGKTYAKGSDLVANVKIAPENDQETVSMLTNLKKFCTNSKTARYCEQND